MAGFLGVDVEVLGRTVRLLHDSQQALEDALHAMGADGHGDIGPTVLAEAAEGFRRRWQYGLQQIGQHASDVADGVSTCRDTYAQADNAFADAMNQARTALDQPAETSGTRT